MNSLVAAFPEAGAGETFSSLPAERNCGIFFSREDFLISLVRSSSTRFEKLILCAHQMAMSSDRKYLPLAASHYGADFACDW